MKIRAAMVALVAAAVVGAAWPWFSARSALATVVPPAPVATDYRQRDRLVAFYESQARLDPSDQITARMLASQYLQRFRESYDIGDVARAELQARRSLRLQPQGNVQALASLASSELSYHHFAEALGFERDAVRAEPSNDNARAQTASLLMELGRYSGAARVLREAHRAHDPTWMSIRARYDELTGNLAGAVVEMRQAAQIVDRIVEIPANTRSWYHFRLAQLAFEGGVTETASQEFAEALRIYPENAAALLYQAKLFRAREDWPRALSSAKQSADLYPLPQALGYEVDAYRALGRPEEARKIDALIGAEQRLFDAQGINDRLLAMYYAEHREHFGAALAAARSDLVRRGDGIYADDTMAWVLASMGRWNAARVYSVRATRLGTQDPELEYHAGVIASHTGHPGEARRCLQAAIGSDPDFHPFYAAEARKQLAEMSP
jgi:tetratricopeptide (TPR) repeat protein